MLVNNKKVSLFNNFITRISGYHFYFTNGDDSKHIKTSLSKLFEIEKEINLNKQNLVESLFRSISSETAKRTRGKLIELKRQVNSLVFPVMHIYI